MPDFPMLPFDRMNEMDVREEVIAPVIRGLGYRTGSDFDVIREQGLRYPKQYIGRKNPGRDPELRGKADYILDVKARVRWVVEAKAPGIDMSEDDNEQAWSYASHPEVRAVYFVLCNGWRLSVFVTNHGPNAAPLLELSYAELSARWPDLVNILSPQAIERDFPHQGELQSDPIGPGLRSIGRISNGVIRYLRSSVPSPAIGQLQTFVIDGAVQRNDAGFLCAYLKTSAPLREMQELNKALGFDGFELQSNVTRLSIDRENPTEFEYRADLTIPQGVEILDVNSWKRIRMPVTVTCRTTAKARGWLEGNIFSGEFLSVMHFLNIPNQIHQLQGDFSLRVV